MGIHFCSPRCLLILVLLILHSASAALFPKITVYTLNGDPVDFPTNERQLVFVGSSLKARSELRIWNQELEKSPRLTNGTRMRGIAILPSWLQGGSTQHLALMYVKTLVPQELHDAIYIYFAKENETKRLFDLPDNSDDNVHLFYLNNIGQVLVYTYGNPTSQKIAAMTSFALDK